MAKGFLCTCKAGKGAGSVPRAAQLLLQPFTLCLVVACRLPQILQNFNARSTGQLSLITYALNAVGAAARIFTSIQEKAGGAMLRGAIISECCLPPCLHALIACDTCAALPNIPILYAAAAVPQLPAGTLFNAVLALQIVVYGSKGKRKGKGRKKTA